MSNKQYQITKEFRFEAAHRLPKHDGKCQRLHGHSFKMRITIGSNRLAESGPSVGMVYDFGKLSDTVKPFVDKYLDHRFLNESTGLENPTSEALAEWIFRSLSLSLAGIVSVEVDETCTSSCRYQPV